MASPSSATVLFTASFRFPPRIVLLVFAALIYGAAAVQTTMTSGHGQSPYFTSPPAITSRELASFLDAVCAGAYGAAHRSHNMSSYVAGTNRTMYGVAECRPDVPVPDCAACLAAASARLIAGRTECAAAADWHDVCFLRYSDGDPVLFRDGDECTATVFNATSTLPPHVGDGAVVRRLLAAAAKRTMRSHMCRGGVGASTAAAFYNTARLQRHIDGGHIIVGDVGGRGHLNGSGSASYPAPAPPTPTPPGGQTPLPSSPAAENPRPPPPPAQALPAVHHAPPPHAATPQDKEWTNQQAWTPSFLHNIGLACPAARCAREADRPRPIPAHEAPPPALLSTHEADRRRGAPMLRTKLWVAALALGAAA